MIRRVYPLGKSICNYLYKFVICTLWVLALAITLPGCGKKKKVISYGYTSTGEKDSIVSRWEKFVEHDSAFETTTDEATGKLISIERAKNLTELHDRTYTIEKFFISSGKTQSIKKYILKKKDGKWKTFYESGRPESETIYENNLLYSYTTWYESGKIEAIGEPMPDSTFRHREFFENGLEAKELSTDANGNGSCTYWYPNTRMKSTGPILNFVPAGVWKGWDTAGVAGPDELIGIPQQK